jgi:hypothetical protein
MCCGYKRCQLPIAKVKQSGSRTIVSAHATRQILFKLWTWIVFLVLIAISARISQMHISTLVFRDIDTYTQTLGSDFATSTSSPSLSACHWTSSSDSALDSSSLALVLASEELATASSSLS